MMTGFTGSYRETRPTCYLLLTRTRMDDISFVKVNAPSSNTRSPSGSHSLCLWYSVMFLLCPALW